MKEIWLQEYEKVWEEWDGNATEEQIISMTKQRVIDRLADMVEARVLQMNGRLH